MKGKPSSRKERELISTIEIQARAHLVALGLQPDPTSLYFLQLAEVALDEISPSSRKHLLTSQLEALRGTIGTKALVWMLQDAEHFEFAGEPLAAAYQALEQLDSQMLAQIAGYPPLAERALL